MSAALLQWWITKTPQMPRADLLIRVARLSNARCNRCCLHCKMACTHLARELIVVGEMGDELAWLQPGATVCTKDLQIKASYCQHNQIVLTWMRFLDATGIARQRPRDGGAGMQQAQCAQTQVPTCLTEPTLAHQISHSS